MVTNVSTNYLTVDYKPPPCKTWFHTDSNSIKKKEGAPSAFFLFFCARKLQSGCLTCNGGVSPRWIVLLPPRDSARLTPRTAAQFDFACVPLRMTVGAVQKSRICLYKKQFFANVASRRLE